MEISDLFSFFGAALFLNVVIFILLWRHVRKRRQKNAAHSFETIDHPSAPLPFAPSMVPDNYENYHRVAKFRTLDSYNDVHLGQMVAALTKAGIPSFWKLAGQNNSLLFEIGGSTFELWVDHTRVDEAEQVLERDYFRKNLR